MQAGKLKVSFSSHSQILKYAVITHNTSSTTTAIFSIHVIFLSIDNAAYLHAERKGEVTSIQGEISVCGSNPLQSTLDTISCYCLLRL